MSNVIEAHVISITGEESYRIIGNTERGAILNLSFNWEKIGGLKDFELTTQRTSELPLFSGMRLDFYFRDDIFLTKTKIFSGYAEIIPTRETNNNLLTLAGKGYYWKLEQKQLTEDYTAETIEYMIEDLDLTGLDISLSSTDIVPPAGTHTISFKNKSYIQVMDMLLKIANTNYSSAQYFWGVNENRELYFKLIPSTGADVQQKYFEGFDFQNPEVKYNEDFINKVTMFRATSADSKVTELVATYEDTESQAVYGIHEKKVTVSDYVATASIVNIANAILSEKSVPKKLIAIKNFYIADPTIEEDIIIFDDGIETGEIIFDDGIETGSLTYRMSTLNEDYFTRILLTDYYGIATKPQEKISLITGCDTLSDWTQSISNSVVSIANNNLLTGRNCLKWTRDASKPAGDYIEFEMDSIIGNLIDVRFYIYFADVVANITFTFYDSNDNELSITPNFNNPYLINTWLEFIELTQDGTETGFLDVQHSSVDDLLEVTKDSVAGDLLIGTSEEVLRSVKKIRITLNEGSVNADEVYIDRIECKNKAWEYSRLTLDKANYSISKDSIVGAIEFGDKKLSLVDEIKSDLKKGEIAFDMFTKE